MGAGGLWAPPGVCPWSCWYGVAAGRGAGEGGGRRWRRSGGEESSGWERARLWDWVAGWELPGRGLWFRGHAARRLGTRPLPGPSLLGQQAAPGPL